MRNPLIRSLVLSLLLTLRPSFGLAQSERPEEGQREESPPAWSSGEEDADDPPSHDAVGPEASPETPSEGGEREPGQEPPDGSGVEEEESVDSAFRRPAPPGKGVVWGRVTDAELHEPIIEAQVRVEGLVGGKKVEVFTDEEGYFRLELPPGTYTVRVFYELHEPLRLEGLQVALGQIQRADAEIVPQEGALEESLIEDRAETASLEGQTLSRQRAAAVRDGVGRAEIAKSTDSNAAEAAQRVVGASIVDGRFVYVRGLGERYTNSLLNGAPLASPDPNRAAVPLDLFPALVLDAVHISKTFTPDLPGDFAGGSVQIETRAIPSKPLFSVSLKGGFNDQATFRQRLDHRGGGWDWLGIDDGARGLPSSLGDFAARRNTVRPDGSVVTNEDVTRIGRDMNSSMASTRSTALPDHGLSVVAGNGYRIGGGRIGYLAALNYDRSYERIANGIRRNFLNNRTPDGRLQALQDFTYQEGSSEVRWGVFATAMFEPTKEHRLRATVLHSLQNEDKTVQYDGFHLGLNAEISNTRLSFVTQTMTLGQVRGEHDFAQLKGGSLDYTLYVASARRDEPDTRDTAYQYVPALDSYAFVDGPDSGRHFWSEQTERTYGGTFNWTQPLSETAKVKFGGLLSTKDRDFWARRFAYRWSSNTPLPVCPPGSSFPTECPKSHFVDDNIGTRPTRHMFELQEGTRSTDAYRAGLDVYAAYALVDARVFDRIRLIVGPRVEWTRQTVTPIPRYGAEATVSPSDLSDVDVLPAASLVFDATRTVKFRASVSRTLARPQVRELAPFSFNDYFGGREVLGNPDLVLTKILNGDVRVEYFPTLREVLALSFFVKDFTDPIEPVVIPGGESTTALLTFRNAPGARVLGAELELRKSLGGLHESLVPFSILSNLTLAHSRIEVPQTGRGFITSTSRPLVNQAPVTFNLALDYSSGGNNARLLFNVVSRRLVEVGTLGLPDGYLQPRPTLDATFGRDFGEHWQLKLSAENLLNAPYLVTQGATLEPDESNVQRKYTTGRIFSITARYQY